MTCPHCTALALSIRLLHRMWLAKVPNKDFRLELERAARVAAAPGCKP